MEVEDDRLIWSENRLKLPIGHSMRMLGTGNKPKEIYDINKTHLNVRDGFAKQGRGCQRLHCRNVSTARHHHVRFGALVVAGPIPDPRAFRAMLDRRFHVQLLKMYLLVGNDDVDVIDASQAMVGD